MHTRRLAFLYSVPIAILGGLIGLGGAEFRLPVLAGPLGYSARRAVPLNLAVSLITVTAAFLTLVFAFGANIKTAGTASLLISFPTITVGLLRYARSGAFSERRPLTETVAPMGVGSVIGVLIGGLLVGIVPVPALKLMLGAILIISALRIFSKKQTHQ